MIHCIFVLNEKEKKMKRTRLLTTVIITAFLMALSISVVSCNYIFKNDTGGISIDQITRVNINKEEAKLLVKASKNNLEIIKLCESIQQLETKDSVIELVKDLEESHTEILEDYKELATEKLISIPHYERTNYDYENFQTVSQTESDEQLERSFEQILDRLNRQMKLMDKLSQKTDNSEFKVLAIKDNYIVKSNIDKIVSTLNYLDQSI